jgi:hypothetical protein
MGEMNDEIKASGSEYSANAIVTTFMISETLLLDRLATISPGSSRTEQAEKTPDEPSKP